MDQQLPPPWMLGATQINEIPMLVVHMQNGELEGLDNLQGGPSIDEETGIREYSHLAEVIQLPEIRDLFYKVAGQLEQHGRVSEDIHEAYEDAKDYSLPYRETEEEEHNPLRALERKGRGGDSKLAYIPVNLAELFIEIRHVPSINPKTGLLEFGFFSKIFGGVGNSFKKIFPEAIRIVGTVGGAILGGPVGAGIGNALAGVATGKSIQNSVVSGLKTGLMAYGAQGLGQVAGLGGATPYTAGFFGGAPNMLASGLGSLGIGAVPGAGVGAAVPSVAGMAAQSLQPAQQIAQAQPGLLGQLAGLAPYAAPVAMAGLSYMGSKKHHQHLQRERERQEERWAHERRQMGWDTNWTPVTSKKYEANPEFWDVSEEDIKHGRVHAPYMREVGTSGRYATGGLVQSYRKGTLVRGKGKGQDDLIKTSVPDGSYIWDASTVSMLGDGSSEAGSKVIDEFENRIRSKVPKRILSHVEKLVKKRVSQVPVYLSDRERKTDPVTVSLVPLVMGKKQISNKKGADILRSTIKNIRKHKSSAGSGLPPKAKPLLQYISAR
jgi:hypothetical protein